MSSKEMIVAILNKTGCLTANEIKNFILRTYHETISSASITGILKGYIERGLAAKSPNENGTMLYWLIKPAWENIKDDESF